MDNQHILRVIVDRYIVWGDNDCVELGVVMHKVLDILVKVYVGNEQVGII